jgi:hypothetical protein
MNLYYYQSNILPILQNHAMKLWPAEKTYQEQSACEGSFGLGDQVFFAEAVRTETSWT